MGLKSLLRVIFIGITIFCGLVKGRIFGECDFTKELIEIGIGDNVTQELPTWICIATRLTKLDSSFYKTQNGIGSYGIFSITQHWCQEDGRNSSKACDVPCSLLPNKYNIREAVKCANQLYDAHGFVPWSPYVEDYCTKVTTSQPTEPTTEDTSTYPSPEDSTSTTDTSESSSTTDQNDPSSTTDQNDPSSTTVSSTTDSSGAPSSTGSSEFSSTTEPTEFTSTTDSSTDVSTTDEVPSNTETSSSPDYTSTTTADSTSDSTTESEYTTTDSTIVSTTVDPTTHPTTDDTTTPFTTDDTTTVPTTTVPTTTYFPTSVTSDHTSPNSTTVSVTAQPSTSTPGSSEATTTDPPPNVNTTFPTTKATTAGTASTPSPSPTVPPDAEMVYGFCELAQRVTYLNSYTEIWDPELSTWLCVSRKGTSMNGSYATIDSEQVPHYGVFKISNRWCEDVFSPSGPCNVSCDDLVGKDYLRFNVQCLNEIQNAPNFEDDWEEYRSCKQTPPEGELEECKARPSFQSANTYGLFEFAKNEKVSCVAKGYPAPALSWDHETMDHITNSGGRIVLDEGGQIKDVDNRTITSTIRFKSVLGSDERLYVCTAENIVAPATSDIRVNVLSPWVKSLIITSASLLFLLGLAALLLLCLRRRRKKQKNEKILRIYQQFKYGDQTSNSTQTSGFSDIETDYFNTFPEFQTQQNIIRQPMPKELVIPPQRLEVQKAEVLGLGAFGVVYKGLLDGEKSVAVKTGHDDSLDNLTSLLSEAKIMGYVGYHPNIVQLLGVEMWNLRKGVVHIALEYCSQGSLTDVLEAMRQEQEEYNDGYLGWPKARNTSTSLVSQLLPFCEHVCSGMQYLTAKRIVHGDLAARNVLVDANGVAKISDFGLSRHIYDISKKYVVFAEAKIPWRWLALETLQHLKFSNQSDVWAYGVLMWEIFSLGQLPYTAGIDFSQNFVKYLQGGFRLETPEHATPEIYQLMNRCWLKEPQDRITFQQMSAQLVILRGLEFGTTNKALIADEEDYIEPK